MTATVFLAICILGCDFLLCALYQWTYGEKRRGLSRNSNPRTQPAQNSTQPFVISPRKPAPAANREVRGNRGLVASGRTMAFSPRHEVQAYRRIATSFAQAKH